MSIPTCAVTGLVAGDSDACGDCDPCLLGAASVPDVVKRLLAEKDEWREKYAVAMSSLDGPHELFPDRPIFDRDGNFTG